MGYSAGTFTLIYNWLTDKNNSIKVQASRMQSQEEDIATGLSTCILKNGTQTITADIPWNSKLITGLGTASAGDHALSRDAGDARYEQTSTAITRSYLAGLGTARASTTTFTVAAGTARDDTNAATMTLGSAITKSVSAWAVGSGNGALDTGAIGASTTYHIYLIKRPDTGVVDILLSQSASAPTMPTNYTLKRRIASIRTEAGTLIIDYTQVGDRFVFKTPLQGYNSAAVGTTAITVDLGWPPFGVQTAALLRVTVSSATVGVGLLCTSFGESDNAVNTPTGNYNVITQVSSVTNVGELTIMTDTSRNIRIRAGAASTTVNIDVFGWIDRRGRDD